MKINVIHLAKLANLVLSGDQEMTMEKSVSSVVEYMDQIKNLNVDKIKETTRVTDEVNIFREDVAEPSLSQKDSLKNAKKTHKGFFVVDAILDE